MSMSESKPKGAGGGALGDVEAADEVFLTPRVLDQGAFREYSESLKSLIREANGKRTDLRTDSEDARQLCENLTTMAARLRERLETTAKLLPTLDDRVKRAERLLEVAADKSRLPERVEEMLRAGVAEMHKRVEDVIAQAEARLKQVEARYQRVRAACEESGAALENVKGRLDEAASLATVRLDELERRLAGAEEQAARGIERLTETAEQTCRQVRHQAEVAMQGLEQRVGQVLAEVGPAVQAAEDLRQELARRVEEAVAALDAATGETVKKIHAVELITKRTIRLLGFDPSNPTDEIEPDSLMMLVQRGDAMERQARETALELTELHRISDQVQEDLRASVLRGGETVDEYRRRGLELILQLEKSIAPVCEQNAALLEQILAARDLLSELDVQRQGVESEVSLSRERVLGELNTLRERAGEELGAVRRAIQAHRASLDEIRELGDAGKQQLP
ncbi:MAG: hypothetical protein DYG94_14005 [Leptolyngbya sp. PLA3]|nr:MAG: hypothetical protein EDM82_14560 [Cyanobacteria bacterium CYA]MCE7969841.1 hypothetical protein [Leptolyngbya sp. PL-A3]